MTAITFAQALTKYRPDQARDAKGRFAPEGGRGYGDDYIDASGGRQSPRTTPASFWTRQSGPTPGLEEAIAVGGIHPKSTWKDWEALSPGMRREIVRSAGRDVESFASRLNEALMVDDGGKAFAEVMGELKAKKPNLMRVHAISQAFWGFKQPKPRSLAAAFRVIQRRSDKMVDGRRASASIGRRS